LAVYAAGSTFPRFFAFLSSGKLVEDLWDSIADSPEIPLTEEQRQEIDRRLAEHDRDPESAIRYL
jgi:hypothetical protein